jgi:integrase
VPIGLPTSVISQSEVNPQFASEVLSRLSDDEVGKLAKNDWMILEVGRKQFETLNRKPDKKMEVRKSTMTLMRSLAKLVISCMAAAKRGNKVLKTSEEILERCNFQYLEVAIKELSVNGEENIKSGMKLNFGYALKTAAKVMEGVYLIRDDDAKAESVKKFVTVLNLQWASVFGDAEFCAVQNRNAELRKPAALPIESDIEKVKKYILASVEEIVTDSYLHWTQHEFARLRDLVVARLTLFNARRGGEPSRLMLREWNDAENGTWISDTATENVTDECGQELLKKYKIAFQCGKGSKRDVPILIPQDCEPALKKLCDINLRRSVKVHPENIYVFASTNMSLDHIIGWNAVTMVSSLANVKTKISATKMRHRASTVYAALEVPEQEREAFYRHMGHSSEINKSIYQCPQALQEILSVGRFFDELDQGKHSTRIKTSQTSACDMPEERSEIAVATETVTDNEAAPEIIISLTGAPESETAQKCKISKEKLNDSSSSNVKGLHSIYIIHIVISNVVFINNEAY